MNIASFYLLNIKDTKMLLMGDATKNNESKLMKIYQLPKLIY